MEDKRPYCPECGEPLITSTEIDEKTNNIIIDLYCDGAGEDMFHLQIDTQMTQGDMDFLDEGEELLANMKVMERTSEQKRS